MSTEVLIFDSQIVNCLLNFSTVFSGVMKKEDEINVKEGAVCGVVSGASSHLSSKVSSKSGKTAIIIGTKVGMKILTSRAKDASTKVCSLKLISFGKSIDTHRCRGRY